MSTAGRRWLLALTAAVVPACGGGGGGEGPPALGVSPAEVRVGEEFVVAGPAFGTTQGLSTIAVGGAPASVVSWSAHQVRALVPAAARSGEVELVVDGQTLLPGSLVLLWPQFDPTNVAVGSGTGDQELVEVASDGDLGLLLVWRDTRNGNGDIYAQRLSVAGAPLWTAGGVAVCADAAGQDLPRIVSDGAGGAIVAWQDARGASVDIYAQRLDATGAPQWTADGIAVCDAAQEQNEVRMESDGAGGAVLVWRDVRNGQINLYAQRLNAAGADQWTADGVALTTTGSVSPDVRTAADGAGGVLIAWSDFRNAELDFFAQRLAPDGAVSWTANGVPVCTATSTQTRGAVTPDGSGGAFVAWIDFRSADGDLYVQRLDSTGAPQWTAQGVAVCTQAGAQNYPALLSLGGGSVLAAWEDERAGVSTHDIFVQRLDAAGVPQWTADGLQVVGASGIQSHVQLVPDGAGGAVLAWDDARSGAFYDVYAQRLSGSGVAQWAANGAPVSTAAGSQQNVRILPDGSGGLFAAWRDARSGVDVRAQRLTGLGHQ